MTDNTPSSEAQNDTLVFTGERYVPQLEGDIALEHWHRYALALPLAEGKEVLDIACGEGYGSNLLAKSAKQVTGVDISPESVAHATKSYSGENLRFLEGACSKIPLQDASVDLVVSFETIEHHDEHQAMMREIRRVLRPNGVLIISSPDKWEYSERPRQQNPYHVAELYRDEFEKLLKRNFKFHALYGQRIRYGSVVTPLGRGGSGGLKVLRREGDVIQQDNGLTAPLYFIAVASGAELPAIPTSLLDGTDIVESDRAWRIGLQNRAEQEILSLKRERDLSLERCKATEAAFRLLEERVVELKGQIQAEQANAGGLRLLEERIAELKSQIQAEQATKRDLLRQRDANWALYREISSSTIWRLTAPIRAAGHFVKQSVPALGRNLFHWSPVSYDRKLRAKSFLYARFGRIFRHTYSYKYWHEHQRHPQELLELPAQAPSPPNEKDFGQILAGLRFPEVEAPKVSIVIPVYGQIRYTSACLASILESETKASYEILVLDDCSTDETAERLTGIQNLRVHRNESNLGFLRSCNAGVPLARGEFVLLLNNDTKVAPGWLDELLQTFVEFPDAGIVGSKLIYPAGAVQESGNYITRDGTSIPIGRSDEPTRPEYSCCRKVDFCSAASIMIRKADWEAVGGFDEIYAPAYYEDPDLAFKVSERLGKNTYVQPLSVVYHYENVSHGEDSYYKLATRNKRKFLDKWKHQLPNLLYADKQDYDSGRKFSKGRVLYIDAIVPVPDRGAGSVDAVYFMKFLIEAGYDVTFFAQHNPAVVPKYTALIQRLGIEVLYTPYVDQDLKGYLKEQGRTFSLVLVARVYQAMFYKEVLEQHCPQAAYVFNTVDVHFLRESRQAEIEGSEEMRIQAQETERNELETMAKADATIVISDAEKELLEREYGAERIFHIPLIREVYGCKRPFGERHDLVFIGSAHLPNVDAVIFYHQEILPRLRKRLPGVKLVVIGEELRNALERDEYWPSLEREPAIDCVGFIEDLADYYDDIRLMVSPLRYGSGVKGKIGTSLSYGVPVVSTNIGVEGMGLRSGEDVLVGNDPEAFADALVRLYNDEDLWNKLSRNGLRFMETNFSIDRGRERLMTVVNSALTHKREQFGLEVFEARTLDDYRRLVESEKICAHTAKIEQALHAAHTQPFRISRTCALCRKQSDMSVSYDYSWEKDADGRAIPNWREHLLCDCGLNNRMRAALHIFKDRLNADTTDSIYLTEDVTPLARWLKKQFPHVQTSEFFGDTIPFGERSKGGSRNETLTRLTFQDESFDFILSFDVLEHIPDYRKALSECLRCLKPNGRLLFSVPFKADQNETEIRAEISEDGTVNHLLPPEYHGDPVDPEGGVLCFQTFGWQLMDDLRAVGFQNPCGIVYCSDRFGYLGGAQLLFVADKPA